MALHHLNKQTIDNSTEVLHVAQRREKMHATLGNLPLELILCILANVPDIQFLVCAVLTGPRLYSVFKLTEKQITETVLLHQLHPDLLHDALAADVVSRKKGPWTEDQALHFIAQYTAQDHQPFRSSFQWQLSQASRLARLRDEIDFVLADLASRVLTGNKSCHAAKEIA